MRFMGLLMRFLLQPGLALVLNPASSDAEVAVSAGQGEIGLSPTFAPRRGPVVGLACSRCGKAREIGWKPAGGGGKVH